MMDDVACFQLQLTEEKKMGNCNCFFFLPPNGKMGIFQNAKFVSDFTVLKLNTAKLGCLEAKKL